MPQGPDDQLQWRPDDDPGVTLDELEAELGHVVKRGRTRKARRTAAVGSTLAVLLLAGGAVAVRVADDDASKVRAVDDPSTTTTAVPTTLMPPSTTTTVPAPRPAFVAVARWVGESPQTSQEIALLDSQSGKHIRTIYQAHGGIDSVTLSPDGKYVYFIEETCGSEPVRRVRVDGPPTQEGELVSDVPSADPALSPDGRYLAYLGFGECSGEEPGPVWALRVRDLVTKAEQPVAPQPDGHTLASPAWSADGRTLAVSVERVDYQEMDIRYHEAFVVTLDPTRQQDAMSAPRIGSTRPGFGLTSPTFLPDRSLFVIETPLGDKQGTAAALMLVVDDKGRTLRRVATGDPKRIYGRTGTDATGHHLLYISTPGGTWDNGGELRVSSNGARTVVLADRVIAADW